MHALKRNTLLAVILVFMLGTGHLYSYDIYSGNKIGSVNIGMDVQEALRALKNPAMKEIREKEKKSLFAKILKLPEAGVLHYNFLYYSPGLHIVLFVEKGVVTGIAVTLEEGMLEGVVDIKRGLEPVLVFYGKAGMSIIKKNNHRIYVYKERGIMFFDDNSNGSVDMIIIWKK